MLDPTKITPEKLAEMNDSLIVDNNHLRQRVRDLEQDAARYRWIRQDGWELVEGIAVRSSGPEGFDADIDAEMKEQIIHLAKMSGIGPDEIVRDLYSKVT